MSAMADPATAAAALSPAALTRAERTNGRIMVSSILGGAYLGFGGSMMIMVAGGTPLLAEVAPGLHSLAGAAVFPIGLALITFSGYAREDSFQKLPFGRRQSNAKFLSYRTEMITGNFCTSFMPLLTHPDRKENVKDLTKSWSISTAGNLVGSVAMATAASSLLFTTDPCITFAAALALKKVTLPTSVLFFKVRVCAGGVARPIEFFDRPVHSVGIGCRCELARQSRPYNGCVGKDSWRKSGGHMASNNYVCGTRP